MRLKNFVCLIHGKTSVPEPFFNVVTGLQFANLSKKVPIVIDVVLPKYSSDDVL